MKTTVDIPDGMLEEAMRYSGAATKREAVLRAIEEYNRRQRMARLAKHLGTFRHLMTRRELERLRGADESRPRDAR
jgi:Arc/MetJ family transcription regulator